MKRYKPSEKLPESGHIRVVVKLARHNYWDLGRYFKSSDQFEIINMLYPHSEFYFSEEIEWWADPMEEA